MSVGLLLLLAGLIVIAAAIGGPLAAGVASASLGLCLLALEVAK